MALGVGFQAMEMNSTLIRTTTNIRTQASERAAAKLGVRTEYLVLPVSVSLINIESSIAPHAAVPAASRRYKQADRAK